MKLAYALHQIVQKENVVEPGTVFSVETQEKFEELLKLDAIRQPTKDEISLFTMSQGSAIAEAEVKPVHPQAPSQREDLEARAKAAGVTFKANISDEKLMERVVEAEGKAAETEPEVVTPPSNVLV